MWTNSTFIGRTWIGACGPARGRHAAAPGKRHIDRRYHHGRPRRPPRSQQAEALDVPMTKPPNERPNEPPASEAEPSNLAARGTSRATVTVHGLRLRGRLVGRGDVVATAPGAWLGGPDLPARIEGFAIDPFGLAPGDVSGPDGPGTFDLSGFELRYAVRLAGDGEAAAAVRPGDFVGTRNESRAITHVMVALDAPRPGVAVVIEALFLAAPIARFVAPRVVLHGPTGSEPLVGLRLRLASPRTPSAPQ
ncbi:hypothetical protein [Rhodoplanes azumiensis]|uniref:Uncharacterized protein n=1 Tax=Rhodoplanes azumiensis TaxID=1897628 RepID=A0ABW5AL69_9BRAD